ncbi:MAG: HAMP domain-containing histidine kinase [Clostridiales bacterium]|nr:HAMP domain-containing histidine kinase [Clostridiales bacterium]
MNRNILKQYGVSDMSFRNKRFGIVICLLLFINLAVDLYLIGWMKAPVDIECDITETNRIYHEVYKNLDTPENLNRKSFFYPFCVVDGERQVLYQSEEISARSVEDAIQGGYAYYELDGRRLLIIDTRQEESIIRQRRSIATVAAILLFVVSVAGAVYWGYLYYIILQPFARLKNFASCVATGNLDIPLEMDRGRVFGLFTESFDILREELKKSRQREYEANVSKKELVAGLSHDIKTPVTSIKLMSEVLMVKYKGNEIEEKICSIYNKADQIDALVTDMFHATLEELGELKVNCRAVSSSQLAQIIVDADFKKRVEKIPEIPDCLLNMDILRIQQIIGNVINNSYKYADTRLEVCFRFEQHFLYMRIRDFGPGVSEDELPHIFQKYYRGKDAERKEKSGAGLGLFCVGILWSG